MIFRNSLNDMNKDWLGWEGKVLILHGGSKPNQAFGRNFAYKNIFLDDSKSPYGEFISAQIYKVKGFNLYAKLV